jgi:class 3 adenylate cyclase
MTDPAAQTASTAQHRDLLALLSDDDPEVVLPAREAASSHWGTGLEAPGELPVDAGPRTVVRTFAFLDLCGSTALLERAGPKETLEVVSSFRSLVRSVTTRRGVRIAKWMGDGAMLVGVSSGPTIASVAEICGRMHSATLPARAGVSVSMALLCDGDDYLGRGANFAARLCEAAEAHEVLVDQDCVHEKPDWVCELGRRQVHVRGMGDFTVRHLALDPSVQLNAM